MTLVSLEWRSLRLLDIYDVDSLITQKHHALIVPYRDRAVHLGVFVPHMQDYFQREFPSQIFDIYIVEQANERLFNRGWLFNVGLRQALQSNETSKMDGCIILHDVDLIPEPGVPYSSCDDPIQLGSELEHRNWSVRYEQYTGGIVSMNLKHWKQINGMSNSYEGWGMEDDDLRERLRIQKLLVPTKTLRRPNGDLNPNKFCIRRPPPGRGRFRSLPRHKKVHQKKKLGDVNASRQILGEMYGNSDRWKSDGLSNVRYAVVERTTEQVGNRVTLHHIKVVPP